MKKFVKVIIAGAVIIGVGLAVLLIALGLNGWKFTPDFEMKEFTSTQEISKLSAELEAGKLKIEYYDGDNVQISYPSAKGYSTTFSEANGKLTFEGNKRRWYIFSWGVTIPETVIKIPSGKLSELELKLNAGSAKIADGAFGNVQIKLNAGTIEVGEITECETFELKMNAGSLTVEGVESKSFSCKLNAGAAKIKKIDSLESQINVNAGSANLSFAGTVEEYGASVKVSAGSCSGLSDRAGGDKQISVNVSAGSVSVSFLG